MARRISPRAVLAVVLGAAALVGGLGVQTVRTPVLAEAGVVRLEDGQRAIALERREAFFGVERGMIGALGLPVDRIQVDRANQIRARSSRTSPTNVGLYLAALVEARDRGWISAPEAAQKLDRALESLSRLDRDQLGFFFNWYDADSGLAEGPSRFVSSVDNGNLFVALTGVRAAFSDHPEATARIDALLAPMRSHFEEAFFDPKAGAITIGYQVEDGARVPSGADRTFYSRLGSEARATVALMEAEGVLPTGTFARMAAHRTMAGDVFKTWDGGVFQWLLPEVLIGEQALSPDFERHHHALVKKLVELGQDGWPAAYSASDRADGIYLGKSGVPALAEDEPALIAGGVLTPHALFLIGAVSPEVAAPALRDLRVRVPGAVREERGFTDAVDLASHRASETQLALDQLMSVLAGGEFSRWVQRGAPRLERVYGSVRLYRPNDRG